MTAFGYQPSVVVGTAGGSLVKCNADAWPAAGGEEGDNGRIGAGEQQGGGNRLIHGGVLVNGQPVFVFGIGIGGGGG